MRRLTVLGAVFVLSANPAIAGQEERVETLWAAYQTHCTEIMEGTEDFWADVDRFANGNPYVLQTIDGREYISLQVAFPEFMLNYDAGFVDGQTFMSCGILDRKDSENMEELSNIVRTESISRSNDGSVMGGHTPTVRMSIYNGVSIHEDDDNYIYYVTKGMNIESLVTFVQFSSSYFQIYHHHVFDVKMGIPDRLPETVIMIN